MIVFHSKLKLTSGQKEYVRKSLPPNWSTEIIQVLPDRDFEVFLRINAKSVEEIQKWISSYQSITKTCYSVETTYKCSGQRVLFKRSYHCQHRTRHRDTYDPMFRRSVKNTNCPSVFSVAIRTIKKRYQGKDKTRAPDEKKPCEIRLKLKHNHSTDNSMALKFKKVLPEVKNELNKLFHQGHTAATALQTLKADIRLNYENFEEMLADRSRCPDYSYCHYLYQKFCNSEDISSFGNEFLKEKLEKYNEEMNDESSKMITTNDGFIICLCPPLLRRIHQHQINSSEIVFLDSFSTSDKNESRIYILLTQSESGGLPLGVIITKSNCISDIISGLQLLKEMLGHSAFFQNVEGPAIFLTDEFTVEHQIVNTVWPKSKNLLSTFHVLQNIWKWLQSSKNGIATCDRAIIFKDFYNIVYSSTESEFLSKFEVAKRNSSKYKHYLKHLNNYFDKKQLWAVCYRPDLTEYSSNYSEIVMRVLRDKIFQRLKSFNLIQMVDFITNNFFRYFQRQLLDISNNQPIKNIFYTKTELPSEEILNSIQVLGKNIRLVPSEKVKDLFYMVNTDLLTCTCFNGNSNSICKHVQWVCMLVYTDEITNNVKNIEIRKKCHLIATGEQLNEDTNDTTVESVETIGNRSNQLFEDMYVAMETNDIVEIDEYLIMKKKDDYLTDCKDSLVRISDKFEELVQKDPENLLPALKILYSRFQAINDISDICTVFGVDNTGKKRKARNEDTANYVSLVDVNEILN